MQKEMLKSIDTNLEELQKSLDNDRFKPLKVKAMTTQDKKSKVRDD